MVDHHHAAQSSAGSEMRPLPNPTTPVGRPRNSYETGESSLSGSLRNVKPSIDRVMAGAENSSSPAMGSSPADNHQETREHGGRDVRARRKNKHHSSGGFLLQDAVLGTQDDGGRRRARGPLPHSGKAVPRSSEHPRSSAIPGGGIRGLSLDATPKGVSHTAAGANQDKTTAVEDHATNAEAGSSPPTRRGPQLDVDATQIVNMALNLSESRRAASRRSVSRSNPPRLAPLPDVAAGSNLKQHLQQQRKTSRTGSPKPNQMASPRIPSAQRFSNPLQSSFDFALDYRYQFSASTLARAQKAKDHLELMALYRQLLEHLPPLKPSPKVDVNLAVSPPVSPVVTSKSALLGSKSLQRLGRPYNPLQYIRNRKVRARERKVIDGEQQGFGDVEAVRDWVEKLAERNSLRTKQITDGEFSMPAFDNAKDFDSQDPQEVSKTALRVRRPRVDWFFDPCDMVADAYWLEQGHHKQLIEDRHLRKLFPPVTDVPQFVSRANDEPGLAGGPWSNKPTNTEGMSSLLQDTRLPPLDADVSSGRRKERAKQKFHDIKSFHHRHNSLPHGPHDLRRMRRDSSSDSSDSDSDHGKKLRPIRRETLSSSANDLLEKQMIDALAQELRDKELADVPESELEHRNPRDSLVEQSPISKPSSRIHSRKVSIANISDSEPRSDGDRSRFQSPSRRFRGRQSLEIPEGRQRASLDIDSLQNSPQLRAYRDYDVIPPMGTLSTPSSRSVSPSRNPLSKVKQKLLEGKSRDQGGDSISDLDDDNQRYEPMSPEKLLNRPTDESFRGHKSTGSMRLRGDDVSAGLRGIFKGPRIDSVIRGGVSKINDMLWKKDMPNEVLSEEESSAVESESDAVKESAQPMSRRNSKQIRDENQPGVKHFIDVMPQFQHVGEALSKPPGSNTDKLVAPVLSRPQSSHSTRRGMDNLPRLDVQSATLSSPAPVAVSIRGVDTDVSDSESNQPSVPDGVRAADQRLNTVLAKPSLDNVRGRSTSRHWSITGRSPSPARTKPSKREVARMRALILSSGITAVEINRRAQELHRPMGKTTLQKAQQDPKKTIGGIGWSEILQLTPECKELHEQEVPACEVYPLASRVLGMTIQASGQRWQASADRFTTITSPELQRRTYALRSRVVDDLSQMTRQAADDSDEASKNLALGEPLKVKHVVDMMERLLRQRRRRFRWVRRALWLTVEWVLIGFMWYVWFVVMILRVGMSIGKGVLSCVKWLLWL